MLDRDQRVRYLTVALAALLGLRALMVVISPAGIGWDFKQYHRAGKRAFEGRIQQLYELPRSVMEEWQRGHLGIGASADSGETGADRLEDGGEAVNSGRLGYVGFPLSAYVWAPVGAFPPRQGILVFKAMCALSLAAGLFLLYPAFRSAAAKQIAALPVYLAIVLLYEPFWFSFSTGGQATPICFLLVVLFHRHFLAGRALLSGLWLAVLIPIKPFFVVFLPVLALARKVRVTASATLLLGLVGGVSLLLLGPDLHREWWTTMRISAGAIAEPWWQNVAILGVAYTWWTVHVGAPLEMVGEPSSAVLHYLVLGFKLLVVALVSYRVLTLPRYDAGERNERHQLTTLSLLLGLFSSSIIWPHYLSFLFPVLIFWLVPRTPLPPIARLLAWLALISTLSVHSRFAQRWVLAALEPFPVGQAAAASLFGSVTLILVFVLFTCYYEPTIRSTQDRPPSDLHRGRNARPPSRSGELMLEDSQRQHL